MTACRPTGIRCPNPQCGRPVCGRVPPAVRRKLKAELSRKHGFVLYARQRPGAIYRVRVCLYCGRRFITAEKVVSNGA